MLKMLYFVDSTVEKTKETKDTFLMKGTVCQQSEASIRIHR